MAEGYELFTTTEAPELWGHIDAAYDRFVELVEGLDPTLRLADSQWTVRDAVGHLLTVIRRYTHGPTLGTTPRDVDRINSDELAALGDTAADALLDALRAEMKQLHEVGSGFDLHARFRFHGGAQIDGAAAMSNVIGEYLIHGRDIARTAGRDWSIGERDSVLVLNGVMQILPAYARRSATASLRLRLAVTGARPWLLDFEHGTLTSRPATPDDRADVVVRTRAEPLLLSLYSRMTPLAGLRSGMLLTGGRRPWRIARLPGLLEQP